MNIHVLTKWLPHRNRTKRCTTIVYHATAGSTLAGALSALASKELSYHYLIDKNGDITKCVPYSKVAYHAGKSVGPNGPNVNDYSVGISFVNLNDGKDRITPAQMRAARNLTNELKIAIPEIMYAVTHFGISWGRKTDPKLFDLPAFANEVGLVCWKLPQATWRLY